MTTPNQFSDLPTVEQRATAIGLRRLLQKWAAQGFDVLSSAALALDELGRREAAALAELAAHPPAHLVAAIGRPDPGDASIVGHCEQRATMTWNWALRHPPQQTGSPDRVGTQTATR